MEHTKTPWTADKHPDAGYYQIHGQPGTNYIIALASKQADARRICAAINATEGITTEALEFAVEENIKLDFTGRAARITELESSIPAINARLLEALKRIVYHHDEQTRSTVEYLDFALHAARAAIAEAENTDFAPYSKRLGEVLPEVIARAKSNNLAANTFELDELRNKAWRLSEIENFLECENLMDEFEEWYLDKQHELAAKHDPTL